MIEEGVRIIGDVTYGENFSACGPAEIMAKGSRIVIGNNCDFAAFVTVTTADSHGRCLGLEDDIERLEVTIGDNVFIGTGAVILGGCDIGHHSVIGAGVVLKNVIVPPYSLVRVADPVVLPGYYKQEAERRLV